MKKSLFFMQTLFLCFLNIHAMQPREHFVSAHYIYDTNIIEIRQNDHKNQELFLPKKHIPSVVKFSPKGRYLVALIKNTSQINCYYDEYSVGATNEIEYPKYSVIVWAVLENRKKVQYRACCRLKFDHRFGKDVRFTDEETMIVIDFDNESSMDFYPDLIVCDQDLALDIEQSKKNGSLREIVPQALNPKILNKFIDTILDIEN